MPVQFQELVRFFPIILLAVSAVAQTTSPAPPLAFTRNYIFPAIGLAGTETLQVNVVNLASVPTGSSAAESCTGTISFAKADGTAIGTPVKFTVSAGQIYSAALPFARTTYASRGEILASVQQTVDFSAGSACSLSMSLETFDTATGVTHAVLSLASPAPAPLLGVISSIPPNPAR